MRTAVVLPAPLGPSSPSTVPVPAAKSAPASAFVLPKFLTRPSALIASVTWRLQFGLQFACLVKIYRFLSARQDISLSRQYPPVNNRALRQARAHLGRNPRCAHAGRALPVNRSGQ